MTNTNNTRKVLFNTRSEYLTFANFWKTLTNNKQASARDHMVYALIQGIPLDQAFTPIKRQKRLECECNGDKYCNIKRLYAHVQYMLQANPDFIFGGIWKDAITPKVKATLKKIVTDNKNSEDVIQGKFVTVQEDAPIEEVKEKTGVKGLVKSIMGAK